MGIALLAGPAFAQDQSPADAQEIVVTGTLISNPNLARSAPVNVTTSDEIELKQSNVAEEILREIPGVVPSIGSAVNNGNGGASFVNLRGLGSNRNIVLLDGVRLVPAELQGRFDLNNIPLALIDRVDVLTGGSSTTYGADAISGVVNFVTKQDFAGLEINGSEQLTGKGDGNVFRLDVTIGANFDDGRGNAVFSVGYQQADPVYQGDRKFSADQLDSFSGDAGGSGTSTPSRFSNVNTSGLSDENGTRQVTADGTGFRTSSAFDAFNFNPYNIFQTPFERFNIYGAGRYQVSDAVEVYTRGLFSKNTVSTIIAPSGTFGLTVNIPLSNPYMTAAQRNGFCAFDTSPAVRDDDGNIVSDAYVPLFSQAECDAAAVATDPNDPNYRTVATNLSRRATEFGPRISDFTTTFFDYRLGAKGAITDTINWDLFGSYGESQNIQIQRGYWLNSRVREALLATNPDTCLSGNADCVPLNIFGPDGSITSEMNQSLSANSQVSTQVEMSQVRGMISGDFGWSIPWADNAVAFAVGGEYRNYHATQESDLLSQSGDLGGAGGAAPNIDGGYHVYEAIGEIVVPLIQGKPFFEDLTLEAGIRYSKYSVDAPGDPSYKTTTWKAGGSWSPGAGVKIRGNYAHAVRAPNIFELFSPTNVGLTNLSDDPCANLRDDGTPIPGRPVPTGVLRDVCIAQGAPAGTIGQIAVPTAGQANATFAGNVNLKPETSNSYTVGVVWQPDFAPGFNISVDYYNIKITNAITTPSPADGINACFDSPSVTNPACLVIQRSGGPAGNGSLSGESSEVPGLFLPFSNLGRLSTDGIDVVLNYKRDLGFADWAIGVVGNWTGSSKFQASPTSVNRECVGYYSTSCTSPQPKIQWSVRNTLSFSDIDVSLLWRHIGSMKQEPLDVIDSGPAFGSFGHIGAKDYFDLSTRFGLVENVFITLTVNNLLDKKPPIVGNTIGSTSFNSGNTFPSTYDALGRRFSVGAKLKF
nr:TonB-dependent receptor [Sphingomonas flavalba]